MLTTHKFSDTEMMLPFDFGEERYLDTDSSVFSSQISVRLPDRAD